MVSVRDHGYNVAVSHVGTLLRHWRSARRLSQLDLALEAEISTRHVSFIETGRAQPSRDMVTRLAEALDIPLRERNGLLIAAGYAPRYRETDLSTPDMDLARQAVEFILSQQEPYPAIVLDRHWELAMANRGAVRLLGTLLGGPPRESNLLRLVFGPDGLRPFLANWEEVAGDLIRRVHQEVAWAPTDDVLRGLLAEILSYPGIPAHWHTCGMEQAASPLLAVVFRKDDRELRFVSTMTTFGTPQDITLEELRIECSFPADAATAQACRDLAGM